MQATNRRIRCLISSGVLRPDRYAWMLFIVWFFRIKNVFSREGRPLFLSNLTFRVPKKRYHELTIFRSIINQSALLGKNLEGEELAHVGCNQLSAL